MKITPTKFDLIGYRIVSPFHLVALTAYAQNYQLEKKNLNVLVIISKGPWRDSILKKADVSDPRLKMTFLSEDDASLNAPVWWPVLMILRPLISLGVRLTNRPRIPICSPTLACLRFSSQSMPALWQFKPILIDEGIGSFNTLQNFRREAKKNFRSEALQRLAVLGYDLVHKNLCLLGGSQVTLFKFEGQKPVLNNEVADAYRRIFRMRYESHRKPLNFHGPVVLILTQPLDEIGACSRQDLMNELEKLVLKIRLRGLSPILKIHPAEDPEKYRPLGVEQVDFDGIVEEIFAGVGDQISEIQGFSSTSLITGSALYGIRSVRVNMAEDQSGLGLFSGPARALFHAYTQTEEQNETNGHRT
ncbi:MAG: hypothetical protein JJ867_12875 [Marinobacter sp.]|nr:hypothetical protein [Marinobacter sp.]